MKEFYEFALWQNEDQINRLKFGSPHYVKMGAEHKSGKFPLLTAEDFE